MIFILSSIFGILLAGVSSQTSQSDECSFPNLWCKYYKRCIGKDDLCPNANGQDLTISIPQQPKPEENIENIENIAVVLIIIDKNGCDSSDGWLWCHSLNKCIRPWRTTTCSNGGEIDNNGCYTSLGEEWCPSLNKCIKPWNTQCPFCVSDSYGCKPCLGEKWCPFQNKCIKPWRGDQCLERCPLRNEFWCPFTQKCIKPLFGQKCIRRKPIEPTSGFCLRPSSITRGINDGNHACFAGYRWCPTLSKCVRGLECPQCDFPDNPNVNQWCESSKSCCNYNCNPSPFCLKPSSITRGIIDGNNPCFGNFRWCPTLNKCVTGLSCPQCDFPSNPSVNKWCDLRKSCCNFNCPSRPTPSPTPRPRNNGFCLTASSITHGVIDGNNRCFGNFRWCSTLNKCVTGLSCPQCDFPDNPNVNKWCESSKSCCTSNFQCPSPTPISSQICVNTANIFGEWTNGNRDPFRCNGDPLRPNWCETSSKCVRNAIGFKECPPLCPSNIPQFCPLLGGSRCCNYC